MYVLRQCLTAIAYELFLRESLFTSLLHTLDVLLYGRMVAFTGIRRSATRLASRVDA